MVTDLILQKCENDKDVTLTVLFKNDRVFVKPALQCLHQHLWEGIETRDGERVVIEVNNANRHIADVRKIPVVAEDIHSSVKA